MKTMDMPESCDKKQPSAKKTYRKPSVQVYGTLSQITQSQTNPNAHVLDAGGNPAGGGNPNNRT